MLINNIHDVDNEWLLDVRKKLNEMFLCSRDSLNSSFSIIISNDTANITPQSYIYSRPIVQLL